MVPFHSFWWVGGMFGWFSVLNSSLSVLCRTMRAKCWGVDVVALGISILHRMLGFVGRAGWGLVFWRGLREADIFARRAPQ
jgi:hypothetical protein